MAKTVNETSVQIRGSSYQIRTDLSPETLTRIAHYVVGKMDELDPKGTAPPARLSVLASLSIAGELLDEQERQRAMRAAVSARLTRLEELLDSALGAD